MLATAKNVLFPDHQSRWLTSGYDLGTGHFLDVASMVVTW